MKQTVCRIFGFDAAHHLPNYEGACSAHHGHHFQLEIEIEGFPEQKTGMIVDFKILNSLVKEVIIDKLDHTDINNLINNPTAENILYWIYSTLTLSSKFGLTLNRLRLYETENSFAEIKL
jgi:6-pyruvoyltetrahydropterin/6-carboxytetrahydropterin synthase